MCSFGHWYDMEKWSTQSTQLLLLDLKQYVICAKPTTEWLLLFFGNYTYKFIPEELRCSNMTMIIFTSNPLQLDLTYIIVAIKVLMRKLTWQSITFLWINMHNKCKEKDNLGSKVYEHKEILEWDHLNCSHYSHVLIFYW